tara:strand:+ start:1898 stop:2452 length:555 start_codon:yes stop_codon:yes gene_type:complete
MEICPEVTVRLFFTLIKFALNNWGWVLMIFVASWILKRAATVLAIVTDVFDLITDALDFVGGIGILFLGIAALVMGTFWASLLLGSRVNPIIKLISLPFFFIAGAVVGLIPIPLPGLTLAVKFTLDSAFSAVFCLLMIVIVFIVFPFLLFPVIAVVGGLIGITGFGLEDSFCSWLNNIITNLGS